MFRKTTEWLQRLLSDPAFAARHPRFEVPWPLRLPAAREGRRLRQQTQFHERPHTPDAVVRRDGATGRIGTHNVPTQHVPAEMTPVTEHCFANPRSFGR